jgi:hypothetical protein
MLGSSQGFKPDLQFTQKKKKLKKRQKQRETERETQREREREREREKKNFCQRNGNRIVLLH